MKLHTFATLSCALLLAACRPGGGDTSDTAISALSFASAPIRLVTGTDTIQLLVELAETPDQRTLGLMERKHMADTAGMLFLYPSDQPATAGFWMFRTRIPLDIAFVDSTGTVRAIRQMAPCPATLARGCPTYDPGVPYRAALEVNPGVLARHKIEVGTGRVLLADTSKKLSSGGRGGGGE